MSSKVKREQLQHALELVSPGLSTRDVVDQSNSFCFKDGKVYTFDDECACIMSSPLHITGAVPAEPLKAILGKLDEEYLEISQEKGELKIKGKGQAAWIRMESKIELPIENLETPTKWRKLPDDFGQALKLVGNCAGRDDNQFELTCVHIHPKFIEAFDTYQYAIYNLKLGIKTETLVRQVSIKHIVNLDMTEYAETEQWLHFKNAAGLMFACRRFTDKYPDLTSIRNVTGKKIQLPKTLSKVTERAEVFSIKNEKEKNYVRVDLKPGWVVVKGEGQYGWYRGRRKIRYTGESLSFMVHPVMFSQLVTQHSECEICTTGVKSLKAELGNFKFVTSLSDPVEIDKQENPPEPEKKVVKKKGTKNVKKKSLSAK